VVVRVAPACRHYATLNRARIFADADTPHITPLPANSHADIVTSAYAATLLIRQPLDYCVCRMIRCLDAAFAYATRTIIAEYAAIIIRLAT